MRWVWFLLFLTSFFAFGAARGQPAQPEGVRALVNGVAALSTAAVITAVRSAETGSFTLAGRAIPFTLASAGIFAALQWGLDQARIAAGSSLHQWNNWDGGTNAADACMSEGFGGTHWRRRGQPAWSMYANNQYGEQVRTGYANSVGGGVWVGMDPCPFGMEGFNRPSWAVIYYFSKPGVPKPSLADWIAGTYTPAPGQTAIAHPEAAEQLKNLLKDKIVADNPQGSDEAAGSGVGIYPTVPPIEWHTGSPSCPSGSIFDNNVKACVNITCESGQLINPATNACSVPPTCPAGSRRVGSSWDCTPNPTCPAGSSFDTSTNQCRPDEAPCTNGQVRDPITRQCRAPDGCPVGQIRNAGGQCEAVQCPAGQILDPVTNLCSDGKPKDLPPTPFDQLLVKIGATITRVVALGSNKIPFGLASYFPSFGAGSGCDVLDITMNLGATLGNVTLPICSNAAVTLWHTTIRPILLGVFTLLGALWIIRSGLQS